MSASSSSTRPSSRLSSVFKTLKARNEAAFIPFIMAGDPDRETSLALLRALPAAGADIIELGVCFTDPMADGPAIQAAGLRALAAGQTLTATLDMVKAFRSGDKSAPADADTPIVLMGYYNPFFAMGVEAFLKKAADAGVDGLIIVDLPPEEDEEMCLPAKMHGIDFIRLATPTTDAERLPQVLNNTSGFVYYVSVAGVTGAGAGKTADVGQAVQTLQKASNLPVAVGFGIKTADKAKDVAKVADAVVVGSALVEKLDAMNRQALEQKPLEQSGQKPLHIDEIVNFARVLSNAVKSARK